MKRALVLFCLLLFVGTDTLAQRAPGRSGRHRRSAVTAPPPDPFVLEPEPPSTTAMFPGNLAAWLQRNLRYPDSLAKSGIEGTVFVIFVVNLDGSVQDLKVIRSSGSAGLDAEALRVVSTMPAWLPATTWGKPVRSIHKIRINFRQTY